MLCLHVSSVKSLWALSSIAPLPRLCLACATAKVVLRGEQEIAETRRATLAPHVCNCRRCQQSVQLDVVEEVAGGGSLPSAMYSCFQDELTRNIGLCTGRIKPARHWNAYALHVICRV